MHTNPILTAALLIVALTLAGCGGPEQLVNTGQTHLIRTGTEDAEHHPACIDLPLQVKQGEHITLKHVPETSQQHAVCYVGDWDELFGRSTSVLINPARYWPTIIDLNLWWDKVMKGQSKPQQGSTENLTYWYVFDKGAVYNGSILTICTKDVRENLKKGGHASVGWGVQMTTGMSEFFLHVVKTLIESGTLGSDATIDPLMPIPAALDGLGKDPRFCSQVLIKHN